MHIDTESERELVIETCCWRWPLACCLCVRFLSMRLCVYLCGFQIQSIKLNRDPASFFSQIRVLHPLGRCFSPFYMLAYGGQRSKRMIGFGKNQDVWLCVCLCEQDASDADAHSSIGTSRQANIHTTGPCVFTYTQCRPFAGNKPFIHHWFVAGARRRSDQGPPSRLRKSNRLQRINNNNEHDARAATASQNKL